jgi:NHLM bacteriocin system ABC transporter ATP-binding protein
MPQRSRSAKRAVAALLADNAPAPLALSSSAPLRIDGESGGWIVEDGRVDLFATACADGNLGRRQLLCSIATGGLILPLPSVAGHIVLAFGQTGAAIVHLSAAELATWSLARRAFLIDRWIGEIAVAALGKIAADARGVGGEPGDALALHAGQAVHAARQPVWIVPRRGRLRLGGLAGQGTDAAIALDGALPIAGGLSVQAVDEAAVDCLATDDALAAGMGEQGLDLFHRIISARVAQRIEDENAAARRRIVARSAVDQQSIEHGLQHLAGVAGVMLPPAAPLQSGDPAVAALGAVTHHQGFDLRRVPRFLGPGETVLRAAARLNGLGLRKVLLREGWWRSDSGVLLGWRGEPRRPVALLPTRHRRYRLWDARDGSSSTVDAATAGDITPSAVMAYPPLPDHVDGVGAMLRLAHTGTNRDIAALCMMSLAVGAVGTLLPLATGYLFGSAVPRAEIAEAVAVVLGLVLMAFGAFAFELTRAIALLRLEGRFEMALQPALMQRLLALPVNFFRGFGSGELMNRVLSIQVMRQVIAGNALVSLLSAMFAMASFAVICFYSFQLAIFTGAVITVAAASIAALAMLELRHERARVALRGREDGLLIQILQGVAKLRVAAAEARIYSVWAALFAQQKRRFLSAQRYAAASEVLGEIFPIVAFVGLLLVASQLLKPDASGTPALGLGAFLAVNAAFGQILAATTQMARALAATLELVPQFERLRPIIEAAPEASADKHEVAPLTGSIELTGVGFRYTAGMRPVLDDVSLRIEPGSFIAFVGPSGSGKSTLLRLLLGFERPEAGDILYDGRSITTLDCGSLRRQIGVVLQHSRLTTGSIFENITTGLPYTLDEAWAAAQLAGIAADIEAMPMGMQTFLLEGAAAISGGQRQRLMIARALIGRPRILLLDEATSALDSRSQAIVMQSLDRLNATRIFIAHRLSTIERADRIYVLERGRIVEAGNYAELIAGDGLFSRLARRQIL